MNELLTRNQASAIRNNIIWMSGRMTRPTDFYIKWWDKQKPFKMEKDIAKLTRFQASTLINDAILGDWENVIRTMENLKKVEKSLWDVVPDMTQEYL